MKEKRILPVLKIGIIISLSMVFACTRTRGFDVDRHIYKSESFSILEKKPVVEPVVAGDPVLFFYRNDSTREKVVSFFTEETGREDITRAVLESANTYDIPLSLAFSVCWVESRYDPRAINSNTDSIDRGLFQLNSKSFPDLSESEFFSIEINTVKGLAYLRYCLDAGEDEIVALAMYNAGRQRVASRGAPISTLEYISQIIDYRDGLEKRFLDCFVKERAVEIENDTIRISKAIQPRSKYVK